eukprot:CAMPEP_0113673586 /NCGR_PEP_ID=MMETSP0038_2-20120614/6939_1 /TAXON_ID=2898 /ORGANISM="Cryptomonas paramecium" /LENGTH=437 /DNA_ID=CAMNT_0000590059 /DNA_START=205 /DNA_END=1518 /DNA_ORIENTATION=- /assembly_acc=CAM_ASM_000170
MTKICMTQWTKTECLSVSGCDWCYPLPSRVRDNGTNYACLSVNDCFQLHPPRTCSVRRNESQCLLENLDKITPLAVDCVWCSQYKECYDPRDPEYVCGNRSGFPYFSSAELTGIALSLSGNVLISASLNLQKYSHNKNQAENGGTKPYWEMPLWWCSFVLMVFGETGNFLAYAYAPATVVAPLGAVSVISNCVLAHYVLKENINRRNMLGVAMALVGAVLIVCYAPSSDKDLTMALLEEYMSEAVFVVFVIGIVVALGFLLQLPDRLKKRYVMVYLLICSLAGCLTVMCVKGSSTALILTFQGKNQFDHMMPFVLVIAMIGTLLIQVKYLNLAMMSFGASEVVPVYYVMFTLASIIGGMVLYKEFDQHCPDNNPDCHYTLLFLLGCAVTFTGVYLIAFNNKRSGGPASPVKPPRDYSDGEDMQAMISPSNGNGHPAP